LREDLVTDQEDWRAAVRKKRGEKKSRLGIYRLQLDNFRKMRGRQNEKTSWACDFLPTGKRVTNIGKRRGREGEGNGQRHAVDFRP